MKTKSISFVWMLICASIILCSCSKDKDKDEQNDETADINAKWEIADQNSKYVSFEFNKDGNYIVVERNITGRGIAAADAKKQTATDGANQPLLASLNKPATKTTSDVITHFGSYTFQNGQLTIVLSGFGVINIISLSETEFTFTVTLTGSTQATRYSATKAANTITTSTKTELLCRTWRLVKLLGMDVTGSDSELTMLISQAGTYFCQYADGASDLSQWKWHDYPGLEKESALVYSHDGWNSSGLAIINTLTENTLILTDSVGILYEFSND